MSAPARLAVAIAASLVLYLVVFLGLVSRPNSHGHALDMMAAKLEHARAQPSPRILVIAGSNARYSHSCAALAAELGRPCTNTGVHWGIGMDIALMDMLTVIRRGDLVYVPMEYPGFVMTRRQILDSEDSGERLRRDPAALSSRGLEGELRALFSFDLTYLLRAIFENAVGPRADQRMLNTVNAEGDAVGHTTALAAQFHALIAQAPVTEWRREDVFPHRQEPGGGASMIGAFVRAAAERGAVVVGGLPTTFDDVPVADDLVAAVAGFYREHGAAFVALPSRSQYPRDHFYDTAKHLTQEAQIIHSRALAAALRPHLGAAIPGG